ncbi:MAG: hypothetical protein HYX63_05915 [Gammaproteobacteria bacterium]|nr:hypothetical protein [Gammaproteobacteria bacterium]
MVAALLDPSRAGSRLLLLLATILLAATWIFVGVIEDVLTGEPLVLVDKAVYHLLQGLRTPITDSIMITITELGDPALTLPLIGAVLLWLIWKRAWRAACLLARRGESRRCARGRS